MADNSPQVAQLKSLQAMADNYSAQQPPIQRKDNPERNRIGINTGLPDNLKTGIENLSGYAMDDVKVHYNSSQPAQLQAHAYTQGTDIHVAPGQEQHLPHEAWHVVQQKQGRVKPTLQMKGKININDDARLEKEADVMGKKASILPTVEKKTLKMQAGVQPDDTAQRVVYDDADEMWSDLHPGYKLVNIKKSSVLSALYNDAIAQIPLIDFVHESGKEPEVALHPNPASPVPYQVGWDTAESTGMDDDYFAAAIIHELMHVASAELYQHPDNLPKENPYFIWANIHAPEAEVDINDGELTENQMESFDSQEKIIKENFKDLRVLAEKDLQKGSLNGIEYDHVIRRISYAFTTAFGHNDTVLADIMYYLRAKSRKKSRTYKFAKKMLKEANIRRQAGYGEVERVKSKKARKFRNSNNINDEDLMYRHLM